MKEGAVGTLDLDVLEKSFNDAKSQLDALLATPLKKSDDKDADDEKGFDESKEGDSEDDDEKKKKGESEDDDKEVEKSLASKMAESPEAEAAMDVEPFLRQLVKSIDERFDALGKQLDGVQALTKAQGRLMSASADLQKSISETVEAIGGQPVKSTTQLRKGMDRFEEEKSQKNTGALDFAQTMEKSIELMKKGKITPNDVIKIEGRLNKGIELDAKIIALLEEEK